MNSFLKFKRELIFFILLNYNFLPITNFSTSAAITYPFFEIDILCPNSYSYSWITPFIGNLEKIGIKIDTNDHTGWAQIIPRTFGYPGPYPIPTYDNGGYDLFQLGWYWGFDWDPFSLYHSESIIPNGDNIYNYNSSEADTIIMNYYETLYYEERKINAKILQEIIYDDLPQITVFYPVDIYLVDSNFCEISWNAILWNICNQPIINWEIPGQANFTYVIPYIEDFHPMASEIYFHFYNDCGRYLHQIYNGLIEREAIFENTYRPWLCEFFKTIDGYTYYVKIKDSANWADGKPITTDDIIYNYQLAVTPTLNSPQYETNIQFWDNNSIIKIDEKEFLITFKKKTVNPESNLALDLLPKHIWENITPANHFSQGAIWAENEPDKLFGAGPYKLVNFDPIKKTVHLCRNDHFESWYGNKPNFENIFFISTDYYKEALIDKLKEGVVDMIDSAYSISPGDVENITEIKCIKVYSGAYYEIAINLIHPYIGTGENCPIPGWESAKHVRKALSHIIPREIIIKEVLKEKGFPGVTSFPNGSLGFDQKLVPYEYDIEHAKEHMELAGFIYPEENKSSTTPYIKMGYREIIIYSSVVLGVIVIILIVVLSMRRK